MAFVCFFLFFVFYLALKQMCFSHFFPAEGVFELDNRESRIVTRGATNYKFSNYYYYFSLFFLYFLKIKEMAVVLILLW